MKTAFVLGNGISRLVVDLNSLRTYGKIYGCNALYREFIPDVLVATDRPISQAIQESGYAKNNSFYTRKILTDSGAKVIPQPYYGYSSGPVALALAALEQHHKIYLLGFDLGPDTNQKFNNVYAGTEFYKSQNSTQTYTGNWVKQITQIARNFPKIQFFRVHGTTTAEIKEFQVLTNFKSCAMQEFQTIYKNSSDKVLRV